MKTKQLQKEDILRFLRLAYFGNIDEPYNAAGDRAYRDFCRTIDFPKSEQKYTRQELIQQYLKRQNVKDSIYGWLQNELKSLDISTDKDFDLWHCSSCKRIITDFATEAPLYYGQAQKWLNMTMKYLLVLEVPEAERLISYFHIPIDNIVIQTAKDVKPPQKPWSQWAEDDYLNYQLELKSFIRKKCPTMAPIIWEFKHWIPTEMFNN